MLRMFSQPFDLGVLAHIGRVETWVKHVKLCLQRVHNIIHIHNKVYVRLTKFNEIFPQIFLTFILDYFVE